jgi:hypothetical protein
MCMIAGRATQYRPNFYGVDYEAAGLVSPSLSSRKAFSENIYPVKMKGRQQEGRNRPEAEKGKSFPPYPIHSSSPYSFLRNQSSPLFLFPPLRPVLSHSVLPSILYGSSPLSQPCVACLLWTIFPLSFFFLVQPPPPGRVS